MLLKKKKKAPFTILHFAVCTTSQKHRWATDTEPTWEQIARPVGLSMFDTTLRLKGKSKHTNKHTNNKQTNKKHRSMRLNGFQTVWVSTHPRRTARNSKELLFVFIYWFILKFIYRLNKPFLMNTCDDQTADKVMTFHGGGMKTEWVERIHERRVIFQPLRTAKVNLTKKSA